MKMHFTKMLSVCCALLFGAFLTTGAMAQGACTNGSSFGSADISASASGALITISTCSFETEYSTITGVPAGEDIEFTSSSGGYITVRSDSSNGAVVAEGFSPVTVSGASGSTLFPHWTADDACTTATGCITTTVQCTSCGTDCPDGNIGDACDDGDPNTFGDVIGADCVCAGAPATGDCLNTSSFGSADLSSEADNLVTISTCSFQTEYSTITGVSAGEDVEFTLSDGGYITVRSDSSNGAVVAQGNSPVTVSGASGSDLFAHWNTDAACGTATSCVATTVQCTTCGDDCPDGNIGDPCDDGDANTENDVLGEDCVCAGTPIPESCLNTSSFGSADISANPNGALITISTCSFESEYSTITGVPAGEDIEFTSSSGGYITVRSDSSSGAVVAEGFSPLTVSPASGSDLFPHWNVNDSCETASSCVTTTVQCTSCATDCPDGNIGDSCDDGDPNTFGDVIGADCVCAGSPATGDCLNTSSFGSADLSAEGSNLVTISTCSFQTEYSTITGISAGEDVEFTLSDGGYITVRSDSSNGAVVAQGVSPVTVSGASGSDLFAHWNTDASCGTATSCVTTTVQCTTCGDDCPDGNIGDPCDDGDPNTTGETLQPDCSCGGGIVLPANDDCDGAISLACGDSIDGTTEGALPFTNSPSGCGFTATAQLDVWYSFEANGTDSYTVTVDAGAVSASWDGVLYVYSGTCDSLMEVGCSDATFSGGSESVSLNAPSAGTYYVQFYDFSGSDTYTVSLACEAGCADPFPAVDESSLMTTFLGTSYLVEWATVDGQIGCQLQLREQNGAGVAQTTVLGEEAGSFEIAPYLLEYDTDYEWRVRCGCSADPVVAGPYSSWQPFSTPSGAEISSLPNPTEGQSNVTFTVAEEGYATLEVFDMSGRLVDAIFTGNAQPNSEYRFEFDGSALPNGVYIYRLTTEGQVLNDKFMIAK